MCETLAYRNLNAVLWLAIDGGILWGQAVHGQGDQDVGPSSSIQDIRLAVWEEGAHVKAALVSALDVQLHWPPHDK